MDYSVVESTNPPWWNAADLLRDAGTNLVGLAADAAAILMTDRTAANSVPTGQSFSTRNLFGGRTRALAIAPRVELHRIARTGRGPADRLRPVDRACPRDALPRHPA